MKENGRCITKLENMGFRVGQGLIERFTKDTARFKDELDIMKFICKDFWTTVFKKQIDNLRTNHQGIYVLQDNKFRLLTQMSTGKQYLEHASKYLAFTCGLIRGGLSNLGIKSIVTAEVSSMPAWAGEGRRRGRESQVDSVFGADPDTGLNPKTPRSRPELKPRVRCSTNCPTQVNFR
ncbi:trafficking protein particle complex subunit 6B isoform X2 [Mirounga angustirostris]|uniref:trafficking protein particle complex subunit 6B isoform X2 n=1 Tax=Mirounga angustirostris TaxID=9716 RepID=UPI0023E3B7B4|nr:trafficking protein particle complex subunit 6B isoform X2 [Mirounga angustirostris]